MIVILIIFIVLASLLAIATLVLTGTDIEMEAKKEKAKALCQTPTEAQDATKADLATSKADDSTKATEPTQAVDLPKATDLPQTMDLPEAAVPPQAAPANDAASTLSEQPVLSSANAASADTLLSDAEATALIHRERGGGRGPLVAINLDTIAAAFKAGETVTIHALKRKGLVPQKAGRIKILARGTLEKPLTVKADTYSAAAIKMICLVGGKAVLLTR